MVSFVLPQALEQVLLAVLTLAAAVWIGGFVTIMVVNSSTRTVLTDADRIALFRNLGRRYLTVATVAAIVGAVCGGILLAVSPFDGITISILVVVGVLVTATILGVVQARRMTRLRHEASTSDAFADQLRHGALQARVLRTLIGVASLALYVLAFVRV